MQPGIYKFINRQSGTAMDLAQDDHTRVVGSPPSDDSSQKWEIAPLGLGHTIRNTKTGTYISVKGPIGDITVLAGHYPAAWQIITVKVDNENAEMIEIHWPHTGWMFDLAGYGSSAPGTIVRSIVSISVGI
ncbi:carbohydrate-binding module family 13 protein [Suillus luteus UH-Slu-Lm8-n1]|uniref:Carbohydrate-binding module family 13 protein n=1 Tax=Suillus luteus UH-Slu-Lm8-n1 TaxID=930992 RepID=A0A0D0B269_9AGAM|nr:carbohydrate-binding module family 13 protein [Suillus luteus UH-Slu-Lm8-n1]